MLFATTLLVAGCKRGDCPGLLQAAQRGDVAAVDAALAKTPITCVDATKHTALHLAAIANKKDVASTLVDHGAALEPDDTEQRTPLCEAAKHNSAAVAELLIAKGAKVEATCRGVGFRALHIAGGADASDVVKVLLAHGAKVNARNSWDQTPLHQVAIEADSGLEVAKLLLDAGAETEIHDNHGFTPLILAAEHNNVALGRLLLERGANPNATTGRGTPVLDFAKGTEFSELLVSKGAKPRDDAGAPPARAK
jgi:ankyrin repeat protein